MTTTPSPAEPGEFQYQASGSGSQPSGNVLDAAIQVEEDRRAFLLKQLHEAEQAEQNVGAQNAYSQIQNINTSSTNGN